MLGLNDRLRMPFCVSFICLEDTPSPLGVPLANLPFLFGLRF